MEYHELPPWLGPPDGPRAFRPPIKAQVPWWCWRHKQMETQNVYVHEVRHWSDGWVAYYHFAFSEWQYGWWPYESGPFAKVWADKLTEGWRKAEQ